MANEGQRIYLYRSSMESLKIYALSAVFAFGILVLVSFYVSNILLYYIGGILFLAPVLAPAVTKCKPKKRISVDGKAVFISGCDSGFGFMLAQRLDDIGFHVFAGCLLPEGPGAERLRTSGSERLHVVGLDVTSASSIQEAETYVTEHLGENLLWAVVNNAGIIEPGELSWTSMESVQKTMDVNTLGAVRLTKAFLLKLKESSGRVVQVTSVAGQYSAPFIVPYCMSKSAATTFCDGLRLELYKWNIQVITIEPASYSTTFHTTIPENYSRLWATAPDKVKAFCPSEYTEKTFKTSYEFIKYFSNHPREIVSAMEETVTALYPDYCYTLGSPIVRFGIWIGKKLPKPLCDMVIFYLFLKME